MGPINTALTRIDRQTNQATINREKKNRIKDEHMNKRKQTT
jgi:hypothetical protein